MANDMLLRGGTNRGIQRKFILFIVFLTIIFSFNLSYELYALFQVSSLSGVISEELPRARGIQEAFKSMLNSRFIFGEVVRLDNFSDLKKINDLERIFTNSTLVFDSYIAALTWGSESEAFLKSSGGVKFSEWQSRNPDKSLIITPPPVRQMQRAGVASIYFSGFSTNAFKAISEHKKFLNFQNQGNVVMAKKSRDLSSAYLKKAGSFFEFGFNILSEMANDANSTALANAKRIENTQRQVFLNVFLVFIFGFLVSIWVIWIYAKETKEILYELDVAAKLLVGRDLELSRSNESLTEIDELKSKFVSTAAHQLRTPLTAIKWSLNELVEGDFGKLKKNQEKLIGDIIASNNRLISLVNDLLDVSRLEQGREIFDIKKQDIISVLRDTVKYFEKTADQKGIKILFEVSPSIPSSSFDKEKIGIAISNLIDNAIKYTMPGGQISIKVFVLENKIVINIADTGIGIPEDQTNRVFNRFFRAHNAMLLETYGSGLGLSVAKEIIEKHDGTISFTSKEGKGTVFTITLPLV